MSAGQPNWQKLSEMGKLPSEQKDKVPYLAQLAAAERRIEELEAKLEGETVVKKEVKVEQPSEGSIEPVMSEKVTLACEHCEYVAQERTLGMAQNSLRLHQKSHQPKEDN